MYNVLCRLWVWFEHTLNSLVGVCPKLLIMDSIFLFSPSSVILSRLTFSRGRQEIMTGINKYTVIWDISIPKNIFSSISFSLRMIPELWYVIKFTKIVSKSTTCTCSMCYMYMYTHTDTVYTCTCTVHSTYYYLHRSI